MEEGRSDMVLVFGAQKASPPLFAKSPIHNIVSPRSLFAVLMRLIFVPFEHLAFFYPPGF